MSWFGGWTTKVFSVMSRREVKPPLSFFFRAILVVLLIFIVAFYGVEQTYKMTVFWVGISVVLLMCLGVFVFAWAKPKNLVYGETGHRAEAKFAFGTEKQELSMEDVAALQGTKNSKMLSGAGEA